MTLVTILQMPSTANAAALPASSSAEFSLDSAILEEGAFGSQKRKRHAADLYFEHNSQENSTTLEWENPCWGRYQPSNERTSEDSDDSEARCEGRKLLLDALKNFARIKYSLHSSLSAIDTRNMAKYNLHKWHYKFLPTLKRNSKIALKRWYRNMQTYVAAFAYLGRKQNQWDHDKLPYAGETTMELNTLFHSARLVLCEIETTINNSFPNSNDQKLFKISREKMNEKLKFLTRKEAARSSEPVEANLFDLMFVKHHYFHYLSRMVNAIRKNPPKCQIVESEGDESASSSMASRDLPSDLSIWSAEVRQQRQKQRQHKRQHLKSAELPQI